MFINPKSLYPVISEDGENTIYVKTKMDIATETDVMVEFNRINRGSEKNTLSAYNLALLKCNVKKWEGPAFLNEKGKPIVCTKANIGTLDPNNELVTKAIEKIDELNSPEIDESGDEDEDPK